MNENHKKLIFVYNADSSIFAHVSDAFKKVVTPSKYECNLCMITYGVVTMKDDWKEYLKTLPFEKEFLHKDEFKKKFIEFVEAELPAVFILNNEKLDSLLSAEDINKQKDTKSLIQLMKNRLQRTYHLPT